MSEKKQRAKQLQAASSKVHFFLHPRVPELNRSRVLGEVYQVTVHELLHLLGLDHCIYFACLMNGSGSLDEDHR